MRSELPKVLHKVQGQALLSRALDSLAPICKKPTVVVGYKAEEIQLAIGPRCNYALQAAQLGTGDAVRSARELVEHDSAENIVVVSGDHALINPDTIQRLVESHRKNNAAISLVSLEVSNFDSGIYQIFRSFGRIVRDLAGTITGIREYKDASSEEREIREVNLGYYCFNAKWLWSNIDKLQPNNSQGEYYLTDLVGIAVNQEKIINSLIVSNPLEGLGINSPEDLVLAESVLNDEVSAQS